jgi:protein SCO1/2
MKWRLLLACACIAASAAAAQPLALPGPPDAGLDAHPGALLPLDAALRDDLGQPVRLRDYFHPGQPVLLVLGYYRCTQLCGLLMQGLLESLRDSGLPRSDWRIVGVSIDPEDTPADAHRRRQLDRAYASFLQGANAPALPLHLDLLVADAAQGRAIAQAVGFRAERLPARGDGAAAGFAHPATVVVATPAGTVSRYFNGVRFDPAQVRAALVEASDGRVGGFAEQVAILCSHFAPLVGRYSGSVLGAVRLLSLAAILGLALLAWRHRSRA